jgi:hypothetical protein
VYSVYTGKYPSPEHRTDGPGGDMKVGKGKGGELIEKGKKQGKLT